MPTGDHPNSRKNLNISAEELRKRQINGGKKSAQVRAAYKSVREVLMDLSAQEHTNGKGQKAQGFEIIGRKLFSMAQQGNTKAMDMYLKLCGELTNHIDVTTNGKEIVNEPIIVEVIDKREQVEQNED